MKTFALIRFVFEISRQLVVVLNKGQNVVCIAILMWYIFPTYPTIPGRACIICIIRLSRARSISSFFFLSDGGLARET